MRLKIVSDGSPRGTRVVNADTGEPLENVIRVSWRAGSLFEAPSMELEVARVPVEVLADVTTWRAVEM